MGRSQLHQEVANIQVPTDVELDESDRAYMGGRWRGRLHTQSKVAGFAEALISFALTLSTRGRAVSESM